MSDDVKTRRRYDSPRRQEQAAQTRRDIIAAAGVRFREHGYAGTSMPELAAAADVAVETIYRTFGSKAGLFREVIAGALAGGTTRAELPVEQRPAIRAVIEEPDPRRQVQLYAATQPGIHRRAGPLLRALRDAATIDKELRALWQEMEAWRLRGQGQFAGMLAERGALRPGLSVADARDIVWTLCSIEVHDLLVKERHWTAEKYKEWLAASLSSSLLGLI